jgi:NAD-reducing hydrogenase large subunit
VPEMLFGIDAAPEQRNFIGLIEANPGLIKRVVRLRKWGQEVIAAVFGKRMHGLSAVPGGVNKSLTAADVNRLLRGEDGLSSIDEVIDDAQLGLQMFYDFHDEHRAQVDGFANVSALNMCLVDDDGNVDYYDGRLRVVDEQKKLIREFDYRDYLDHFSEGVEKWTYMKFPFLTDLGRDAGSVRVGPLARLNVTRSLSTPIAAEALEKFHAYTGGRANNMTLHTNWARTIEIIHAAEVVRDLLNDPDLQRDDLVVSPGADAWTGEGVGVVEAPRGTLLHHYRADREGNITFANLIVATTQNNQVLNRTVRSVAEDYLGGQAEITEGMMNAIEVGIRAYDPCLSCATHALGQMPLIVTVVDAQGRVLDERAR